MKWKYVDDMIAKSKEEEDHLVNLGKMFNRLRKYQLRFNSTKCVFGTTFYKLLVKSIFKNIAFGKDEGFEKNK